jgi:hypothetical protein
MSSYVTCSRHDIDETGGVRKLSLNHSFTLDICVYVNKQHIISVDKYQGHLCVHWYLSFHLLYYSWHVDIL